MLQNEQSSDVFVLAYVYTPKQQAIADMRGMQTSVSWLQSLAGPEEAQGTELGSKTFWV